MKLVVVQEENEGRQQTGIHLTSALLSRISNAELLKSELAAIRPGSQGIFLFEQPHPGVCEFREAPNPSI